RARGPRPAGPAGRRRDPAALVLGHVRGPRADRRDEAAQPGGSLARGQRAALAGGRGPAPAGPGLKRDRPRRAGLTPSRTGPDPTTAAVPRRAAAVGVR